MGKQDSSTSLVIIITGLPVKDTTLYVRYDTLRSLSFYCQSGTDRLPQAVAAAMISTVSNRWCRRGCVMAPLARPRQRLAAFLYSSTDCRITPLRIFRGLNANKACKDSSLTESKTETLRLPTTG